MLRELEVDKHVLQVEHEIVAQRGGPFSLAAAAAAVDLIHLDGQKSPLHPRVAKEYLEQRIHVALWNRENIFIHKQHCN